MTTTVVTGSSTGIGYATAVRLAKDGHDVIAAMRTPDACEIDGVRKAALDVNDDESVDAFFQEVGPVDILVNNAGISYSGAIEEVPFDQLRAVMETNYFGVLRCTKAVLPSMRERNAGCIVTVTSQAGRMNAPTLGAYNASKWAIESAMETLAIEVAAFGIRVALIEPGAILTPIIQKANYPEGETPYMPMWKRFGVVAMNDFGQGSAPEVVADTISEAISTDEPRLRWLTGMGAERNIATREAMSDAEWIETWNHPDNHEFKKRILGA